MASYRVVAIPAAVAAAVRRSGVSPFAQHPAHSEIATGHGPCRLCLQAFKLGEERRILFTYDPFAELERLPLPGPVFIHEADCDRYPEGAGLPADLRGHSTTLNAYGRGRELRTQAYAPDGDIAASIEALLDRRDVDYIHVRDTEAGCFDFLVAR